MIWKANWPGRQPRLESERSALCRWESCSQPSANRWKVNLASAGRPFEAGWTPRGVGDRDLGFPPFLWCG